MSSLATPQGITMGTTLLGGAGQYAMQNGSELASMGSEFGAEFEAVAPELSSVAA